MKAIFLLSFFLISFTGNSIAQEKIMKDSIAVKKHHLIAAVGFPYWIELGAGLNISANRKVYFETRFSPLSFHGNWKAIKIFNLISMHKKFSLKNGIYGAFGIISQFQSNYNTIYPWQYHPDNISMYEKAFYTPNLIVKIGFERKLSTKSSLIFLSDCTYFFWKRQTNLLPGFSVNYLYNLK